MDASLLETKIKASIVKSNDICKELVLSRSNEIESPSPKKEAMSEVDINANVAIFSERNLGPITSVGRRRKLIVYRKPRL